MWREKCYSRRFDLSWSHVDDTMERIDADEVSVQEFIRRFEEPYLPVVITNAMKEWPAMEKWTVQVRLLLLCFKH